jgi:ABC-type taurine transport system ATPase subunit
VTWQHQIGAAAAVAVQLPAVLQLQEVLRVLQVVVQKAMQHLLVRLQQPVAAAAAAAVMQGC